MHRNARFSRPGLLVLLLGCLAALMLPACGAEGGGATGATDAGDERPQVVIGVVAKSQSNPVFQAAYAGAKAAAAELSDDYGVRIVIDWQTPPEEDAQKQAEAIELLARSGAAGIAVSCTNAETVTPAIDKAVELGAQVLCFDSDAPASRRFCFFGTDDISCGEAVMKELAVAMGDRGTVAILAGNQAAPNLQNRAEGVRRELRRHPRMSLLKDGVFYHDETPEQAAEALARAQSTHPEIAGWALIGGWPLYARGGLKWEPDTVAIVSVDALPEQLGYLESGHVALLLAQDCFGWGYRAVQMLMDKITKGVDPDGAPVIFDALTRVTVDDVPGMAADWDRWLGIDR